MTISSGMRLGPYEIVAPAGAGGMGEVWKARDTRLDRSVAIKVLPAEFAQNAQLRLRFEREAKSISQLNHPHICTLYDVGSHDGVEYLVMEFIDGQTLADRLANGPLPFEQVIRYAIEIAEALERAHKAGIVHRDLKPGNVMLTKSGAKLLDFGLAKSGGTIVGAQSVVNAEDATLAAMAARPLTEEGTIVGTFQYMAPEQIEGREADARTDIFALGAVLYEMVTGRRAFAGKSKATLIASILATEPPPIGAVQPASPVALDRLIRICLAKDPDDRWQSAHDLAIELRRLRDEAMAAAAPAAPRRRELIAWGLATIALIATLVSAYFAARRTPPPALPSMECAIPVPDGSLVRYPRISPDGTKLAFVGLTKDNEFKVMVRDLASATIATMNPTPSFAPSPEWSPDSREFLSVEGESLLRVSPAAGTSQVIQHGWHGRGFTWGSSGSILTATGNGIESIPESGGKPRLVIRPDASRGELTYSWPVFLPDGEHFLYLSARGGANEPTFMICVSSLDGRQRKDVVASETDARYANGYLLFGRGGKLLGQPFDLKTFSVSGEARVVGEELLYSSLGSSAGFSVSNDGLLVYRRAASISPPSELQWFDRSGRQSGTLAPLGQYWDLSLSRDGRYVAVQVTQPPQQPHIWSFDVVRKVNTLLTPADKPTSREATPVWMPDGRSLLYAGGEASATFTVYRKSLDGRPETVVNQGRRTYVCDVTRDGRTALIASVVPATNRYTLETLSLASGVATPVGPADSSRFNAKLAPDEKWIAFVSNDTGRREVYISSYPDARLMTRVSTSGGQMPYWSADGRKLYYGSGDLRQIMEAGLTFRNGSVEIGEPRSVVKASIKRSENTQFVVTPDERILANVVETDTLSTPLTLITNWTQRLKQSAER